MRYFVTCLQALWTTFKNIFRKTATVQFPKVIRPRPARYRTSFALLHDEHGEELCIGCLACERICPSQVIAIKQAPKRESKVTGKKRGFADDFVLDATACIFCELCVQVCPEDAIVMLKVPDEPAFWREDIVLTMAKLYENERKPHSWALGSRLMAMQEPPKAEKKEKPAAAKPQVKAEAVAPAAAAASPAAPVAAAAPTKAPISAPAKPVSAQLAPVVPERQP